MTQENEVLKVNGNEVEGIVETNKSQHDVVLSATEVFTGGATDVFSSDKTGGILAGAENLRILSSSDSESLSDRVNTKISIVKFVAGQVEIKDMNTDELTKMLRVVIVTDDGETLSTVSKSAITSLGQYNQFYEKYGMHVSKETPLPMVVKQVKTKNGFTATVLELDNDIFSAMAKKLGK